MEPEVKQAIEKVCADMTAFDPWLNRQMCERILQTVDFDAPGTLVTDGPYSQIQAQLQDGRKITMGYIEGGWYVGWEEPRKVPA